MVPVCLYHSGQAVEDVDREYYSNQIELLETMQLVWSLCEILFIDIMPGETWTTVIEPVRPTHFLCHTHCV